MKKDSPLTVAENTAVESTTGAENAVAASRPAEDMENTVPVALRVDGLSKIYGAQRTARRVLRRAKGGAAGPVQALDDVSFTLTPGLYGLLGPNGAGKSTLINIITGSLLPSAGRVTWGGADTRALGIRFRRVLGYMPQQQGLYDRYSGRNFLLYMAALKEVPRAGAPAAVEAVAAAVNLADQLEKHLSAYSGGMKQRLLAAAAILGDPRLLIMDEPTAGLDPKERVRLRRLMAELAKTRVVLVATHVVSDVETVADQILLLRAGRLVDMAPPADLVEKYAPGQGLEDVYLHIFGEDGQ